MDYKTFGDSNHKTILLPHGNLMCWRRFADVIPLPEESYRVIAVSFDGFDGSGTTAYPGAKREAEQLAEYIRAECGGRIACLYAESLGRCPAIRLRQDSGIEIEQMILSGAECLDCGILNGLMLKLVPIQQQKMIRNFWNPAYRFPWHLMKITGQTQEGMRKLTEAAAENVSLESLRETCKTGLEPYGTIGAMPAQPDAAVACWNGEKESGMKKGLKLLRRLYPRLTTRCFTGYGHGEIMRHPAQLAEGIIALIEE